jgi:hypothetical protein
MGAFLLPWLDGERHDLLRSVDTQPGQAICFAFKLLLRFHAGSKGPKDGKREETGRKLEHNPRDGRMAGCPRPC